MQRRIFGWLWRGWRWLGSMRLAVMILCLLALAATLGAVIPQAPTTPNADLIHRRYGPVGYALVRLFLLGDVFHAWWFLALLVLFSVNLTLCTVRRLRRSARIVLSPLRPLAEPDLTRAVSVDLARTAASADRLREAALKALKQKGFHALLVGDQVVGTRWRYAHLAPDLVHAGVVMILAGAFLGAFRFQGRLYVGESQIGVAFRGCSSGGGSDCLKNVPFDIRVDAFGAELYPGTAAYGGFWTMVTVIEDGVEVKVHRIELNRPLTHRGISFYQSFYGYDLNAAEIKVLVVDWNRRASLGPFQVRVGESFRIPGTEDSVLCTRFFTSFAMGADGRPINVNTPTPQNPAATLLVHRRKGSLVVPYYSATVFANSPAPSDSNSPYGLYLESYRVPRYVGLTYSRDPGYPVVWWGFIVVMVGLGGAFYLRPRRVWAVVDPRKERVFVLEDPSTRGGDRDWLQETARSIEREVKGGG